MCTEVNREYECRTFQNGQLKQFALKLAKFCNIAPQDGYNFLHYRDDDFYTNSKVTVDELQNINEIGTQLDSLAFHYKNNIIQLILKGYPDVLRVLYVIDGNVECSKRFIFFVENNLALVRLKQETENPLESCNEQVGRSCAETDSSNDVNNQFYLQVDEPLFELMRQVFQKESEDKVGWSFEKYFSQVIQSHCQERIDYRK